MNTTLPYLPYKRLTCLAVTVFFSLTFSAKLYGQCAGNLLVNPGFESPAMTLINGNNIMGAGVNWGGWSCTNGGLNILRVQGSGYASGANIAADGSQYVDVANSDGYIYQQFTLTHITPIAFNGSFSNREMGWGSFVNWTGRIDILDSTNTVIATSSTRSFVTTDNNETWYTLTGSTSNLVPGKYTYRAYAGNSGHFDNAGVCALFNTVLSVKMESFTATTKNNQVETEWIVSEEENLKGYELQWSTDGRNFKTLNFVPAAKLNRYDAVHANPVSGTNYYRLKISNLDGKTYYSTIDKVDFTPVDGSMVYPNPASGSFVLTLKNDMVKKNASFMIVTASGRIVQQRNFTSLAQSQTIDISQLSPGVYFVRVVIGSNTFNKTLQVAAK